MDLMTLDCQLGCVRLFGARAAAVVSPLAGLSLERSLARAAGCRALWRGEHRAKGAFEMGVQGAGKALLV